LNFQFVKLSPQRDGPISPADALDKKPLIVKLNPIRNKGEPTLFPAISGRVRGELSIPPKNSHFMPGSQCESQSRGIRGYQSMGRVDIPEERVTMASFGDYAN
jgi:hypothetical protein